MSISLNDHESRISALESKINSNGFIKSFDFDSANYIKEYSNGVIEQGGLITSRSQQQVVNLKRSYKNTNYLILTTVNDGGWGYVSGGWSKTKSSFNTSSWQSNFGGSPAHNVAWMTIGYLISDRILKYIREVKNYVNLS